MNIEGKAEKLRCPVCGGFGFYIYKTKTELMLMIRCMDCENSKPLEIEK